MPVSREGDWCHKHRKLVPRDVFRRVGLERSKRDAIDVEAKYTRGRFADTALKHGLAAPETSAAYEKMVVANGADPPVPEWLGKP